MKTVLIFAYECAPYNRPGSTIGAQRPYQFAKYLPEFGWRCVVITSDYKRRRTIDRKDLGALREEIRALIHQSEGQMSVIIPTPSLKYADHADRLWWKFTGTDPENGTHFSKGGLWGGLLRKIITFTKLFRGDHSQSWQACARVAVEEWIKDHEADVVIGEHGPDAGIYLARWLHRKYKVPWIADFRDPVEGNLRQSIRTAYLIWVKKLLASTSAIIQVMPYWAELDRRRFKKNTFYIPNGYDIQEFKGKAVLQKTGFVIVYTGSIKKSQTLDPILNALKKYCDMNKSNKPDVTFIYRGNQYDLIRQESDKLQISQCIDSKPFVPRDEVLKLLASADLLLLLSDDTSNINDPLLKRGHYPGKVFEYFAVAKPILCIPGDGGVLNDLISETKTGETCKTAEDVYKTIIKYIREKERRGTTALPLNDQVNKYSRRELAKELAGVLSGIL